MRQEARLLQQPNSKDVYDEFLREYIRLGHMQKVPTGVVDGVEVCYLPHHPVYKVEAHQTKVRVVFNASFPSSNSKSLNDCLRTGPKLQADLPAIVLNWRKHRLVVSTDLEKMFRQIRVHSEDVDLQRILWRECPSEEIAAFQLRTVTYGTSCAPFLANRVLKQLVRDEGSRFPLAAQVLERSVYVDDIMFGGPDVRSLQQICGQLNQLLRAGGFRCHKWATNCPSVLDDLVLRQVPVDAAKQLSDERPSKVLGLHWIQRDDIFKYDVEPFPLANSKRALLSLVSRIFDPLGWAAPVLITGKILIQRLWMERIGWDDPLPVDLESKGKEFQEQLTGLNSVNIPRWTRQHPEEAELQVHGFCDASNAAYAACVYFRAKSVEGCYVSTLMIATSKVAPVKSQSIPRLELCAAVLLARLIKYVLEQMNLHSVPVVCWSDSTVVLAWLQDHPSRWKVFVANRVSEIQVSLPMAEWRHVPTHDNPADSASRGINAWQLLHHPSWWHGPAWLVKERGEWPSSRAMLAEEEVDAEERANVACVASAEMHVLLQLADRVSSWQKLLRVIAYVNRFIKSTRHTEMYPSTVVSVTELRLATTLICKTLQAEFFSSTLVALRRASHQIKDRCMRALNPAIDEEGLLRVGGRLANSALPYSQKCPVILPACRVTKLLARHFHEVSLHSGLQLTLRLMRNQYWVISARSLTKGCIRDCVSCTRHRAALSGQQMGELPSPRVTPSRPFSHVGIDYAGPFSIRSAAGRGQKSHKGYLIVFVCLSVRAIHLECANDYSTAGFLAAFDRFTARRGLPSDVYSDNGTNFVGADKELTSNYQRVVREAEVQGRFAADAIEWHFIPPAAPHFGGLWEAGVKSVKHHLRRIIGQMKPTFEEFSTLLCKIEAVLNSRPIAPLLDDPESYAALTPGHFLVGDSLKSTPNPSVLHLQENRLSRWQAVQKMFENFWRIWSKDYLNSLQQRKKWSTAKLNLCVGDLVLIKHPQLPPSKWELGRIEKTLPGQDGLIRVVTVRTQHSTYKRPVSQLCKLPVNARLNDSTPRTHSSKQDNLHYNAF